MKKYIIGAVLGISCSMTTQANVCQYPYQTNNQLVNNIISFKDTSPFFKTNSLYNYKPGIEDIDTTAFNLNFYGNKLNFTGNSWKMLKLKDLYTVTPNTMLEFEFRSNGDEAEINGVGLIMKGANQFEGVRFFQVHGTETPANYNQDYHDYTGNKWMRYQIPLWNSTSNTPEKRIDLLVFAGDDDNQQMNQNVHYKNVRLTESLPTYQLPSGFQHDGVVVEPTTNPHIKNHVYYQTITGPDGYTYPVSGGKIIQSIYQPNGTSTSYILKVHEYYYDNLCWEDPINFNKLQIENAAYSNLEVLAKSKGISGFDRNQNQVSLKSEAFFDPDFTRADLNQTKDPSFIYSVWAISDQSHLNYFDRIKSSNLESLSNGFFEVSAQSSQKSTDCNNPGTGTNTVGQCFDLSGLTKQVGSLFEARNTLSDLEVFDDQNDPTNDPVISKDQDDKWSEDDVKQQTTEMLINMSIVEDYFDDVIKRNYLSETGYNKMVANLRDIWQNSGAKFNLDDGSTSYQEAGFEDTNGYDTTWTRDPSIVGHEFSHGLIHRWYGISMATVEKQGCAINEAFADIMGAGAKRNHKGFYQTNFAVDVYDSNNPRPEGLRNFAVPASTNGDSVYIGNNANIPGNCSGPPATEPPSCEDWYAQYPEVPCPYNWEGYAAKSFYAIGNVITHLYHLMVTGGFNAEATFRPDSFGVSPDEVYSHAYVEKLFYDALRNENNVGHSIKFCELRDRMLTIGKTNTYTSTAIQQAWKHVYMDIQTICPLPSNIELLEPQLEMKDGSTVISEGGQIDLGTAEYGQTVNKTITVKNTGEYPLRLINPEFSNAAFSQNLLSTNQTTTIDLNETVFIQLSFLANSTSPGFNQSSLIFETNLPNGDEDKDFYTIHLTGTSSAPQATADAYEEDDTLNTASIMNNNSNFQLRNFADDNIDFIKLQELGMAGQEMTCQLQLKNLGNLRNFCVGRYDKNGDFINTECETLATNSSEYVNFYQCDDPNNFNSCELVDLKVENQSGQNSSSDYSLAHSCIFL